MLCVLGMLVLYLVLDVVELLLCVWVWDDVVDVYDMGDVVV